LLTGFQLRRAAILAATGLAVVLPAVVQVTAKSTKAPSSGKAAAVAPVSNCATKSCTTDSPPTCISGTPPTQHVCDPALGFYRPVAPVSTTEYVVTPTGVGNYATIQEALDAAKKNATPATPITVRLLPGVYTIPAGSPTLTLLSASYVNLMGAGPELTIVRGGEGFMADAASGDRGDLFDISGSKHLRLEGIYFDNLTNVDRVTKKEASAIFMNDTDDILINRCRVEGNAYGAWANANSEGHVIETYDSRFVGGNGGIRTGPEIWHIFSGSMMSMVTDARDNPVLTAPLSAFQAVGPTQIWGAHIHCEDMRSASRGCIGAELQGGSRGAVEIFGTTIHVKVSHDSDPGGHRRFAPLEVNSSNAGSALRVSGCNMLIETPNVTDSTATIAQLLLTNASSAQRHEIIGNSFRENVSATGLYQRGTVLNRVSSARAPTVRWLANGVGSRIVGWTASNPMLNGPVASFETTSMASQSGSATLASGTRTVLLIADAGNAAGTVRFNASATVDQGTSLDTIFKPGDFVKNAADGDTAWTRIRSVSPTTLALEEPYRGRKTGTGQVAKIGNQTLDSQPDGSYRVSVTGAAAPAPYTTTQTISSCDHLDIESPGESTDRLLQRADRRLTLTSINCVVDPGDTGESARIALQQCDTKAGHCVGVDGATTITCDNDGQSDDGSLSNPSIDKGNWMFLDVKAVSGTVSRVGVTYCWTAPQSVSVPAETFSVTNRHASGFTITSSNPASTAAVDWVLTR